jgi:lysophospholipase L1-like esterase
LYWYSQEIERLKNKTIMETNLKKLVFWGSSSFTLWENLENEFTDFKAINLGFGGSTLAACAWFYEVVVPRHHPDAIFIYAGDNDLSDGRTPEEVIIFFYQLVANVRKSLGNIPICFISIKLSPARANLKGSIEYTNHYIQDFIMNANDNLHFLDVYQKMLDEKGNIQTKLYQADGLHLSTYGYEIWHTSILNCYNELF